MELLTESNKEQMINYFKYVSLKRKKIKILKYDSILFLAILFFYYSLIVNQRLNSLTFLQTAVLCALAIFFASIIIKEFKNVKFLFTYLNNNKIKDNIQIELGKIRYINTNRVDCRVTVLDSSGDAYIADYAPELLSDLYNEKGNKTVDAYLIYIKGKKNRLMAAYPSKYFEN